MSAPETAVVDLQAMARSILGVAPVSANEAQAMVERRDELADMRAEHAKLRKTIDELDASLLDLKRAAFSLERELMLREGRSHLLHFSWIEAWLEGRHEDCETILASEEYRRELRAACRGTP